MLRFKNVPVPEVTLYCWVKVVEPAFRPVSNTAELPRCVAVAVVSRDLKALVSEAACVVLLALRLSAMALQ